jgi:hypothetical protein
VTIGSSWVSGADFDGWDLTNLSLVVNNGANVGRIMNCRFGETLNTPAGRLYFIDQYSGTSVDSIEYNTFEGPYTFGGSGTAINSRASGSGASFTPGNIRRIAFNRFLGLTSDHTKVNGCAAAGGQIIEWNYFGASANLPNVPTDYDAGVTYAAGYAVRRTSDGWVYISKVGSNTGNALPLAGAGKTGQNDWWLGADPHADHITTVAAIGDGITIRRNLFDHTLDPPGVFGPYPGMGLTNALRLSRNTGTDHLFNRVEISENVVFRAAGEGASAPIQVADGSQPNFNGPVTFTGNWLSASSGGTYFHPTTNGLVSSWSNNRDYVTDDLVTGPTLVVTHTAILDGQSQEAYWWLPTDAYNGITRPTITGGNLTVHRVTANGAAPVSTLVTNAALQAKDVSIAVGALSQALNYIVPGRQFHLGGHVVPGTGRYEEADNANSGRLASDKQAVVDAVRTASGKDVDAYIECWMGNDSSSAKTMHESFAPLMYKQTHTGAAFTLGSTNAGAVNTTAVFDNCRWDATAHPDDLGQGIFRKGATAYHMLGWPTHSAVASDGLEMLNFSTDSTGASGTAQVGRANQHNRPARANYRALLDQGVGLGIAGYFGPGAHSAYMFEGGSAGTHPSTTDPEGVVDLMWSKLPPLLKLAGRDVTLPTFGTPTISPDRLTITVPVVMPTGATLTTKALLRGQSMPGTPSPHQQEVTGFELRLPSDTYAQRRPIFRTDSGGSYPDAYKGTVTITGGVIQIVMSQAIPAGTFWLYFLDGDVSATLLDPRDPANRLYRHFPLAHVSAWYDSSFLYPFPGLDFDTQVELTVVSADVTAPVLSGVSVAKTDTTATLSWSTDEGNGTAYWLVDANATRTAAQVIAAGNSRAVTTSGAQADFSASGLTASTSYHFHLVHQDAAGNNSAVNSTSFATDAAAPSFFTMGASGPYFVDPANVPASTTVIEYEFKFRIPTGVTLGANSFIATQESTGFDLRLSPSNGRQIDLLKIEDGTGATMLGVTAMATNLPLDTWLVGTAVADQVAQTLVWALTGYAGATVAFTGSSNGVFQTGREISFLATTAGGSIVSEGVQFEYVRAYFTTSGVRTLRKEIAGDAAAVNADAWKQGGNAT